MHPADMPAMSASMRRPLSGKTGKKRSGEHNEIKNMSFGYVLKGSVTLVCGSKKYKIKDRETFYLDGTESHYLYNHGKSDAKVLWITTPPMF